jgi:uncharacterized protein YacL
VPSFGDMQTLFLLDTLKMLKQTEQQDIILFGRRMSSIASNFFGVLTILATLSVFTYSNSFDKQLEQKPFETIILAIGIVVMFLCQFLVHFIKNDDESRNAISLSVHAYILLLTSIIVLNKNEWVIPMIIFYALFNLTMIFRPAKNQI